MTRPKVTIGICARNCEKSIPEAIESVILQDYPHDLMEMVFVDDGSIDNTARVIQEYTKKTDIKSKVFRTQWQGLGSARNLVGSNADGKYIIWVDCDEELEENYVRTLVNFLDENPNVGIALGLIFMKEGNTILKLNMLPFYIERMKALRQGSSFHKIPGTGGAAMRAEALRQVGGFDEKIRGAGEDVELAYRIKSSGWLIGITPARFYEKKGDVKTLKDVWNKFFWYGYGNHKVYMKNRKAIEHAKMTPLAGIVAGILYAAEGCRLTKEKLLSLLLPASFAFNFTAWCLGFTKSHLEAMKNKVERDK
jgi:glycosyltransferase involved in cell wall biosynthesis